MTSGQGRGVPFSEPDLSTHFPYMSRTVTPFLNRMAEDSLQRVRNWFSQSKLGEYVDLCISNGFDSLELIFEHVWINNSWRNNSLICLPGKRQQLLLAIRQQKESN